MEKKAYPKVLMLVLASKGGPHNCYDEFITQWLRYANSHPNIDCYLYLADNSIEKKYDLSGNILRIKLPENWNTILDKTFDALEFFQDKFKDYDWICRPNMSAFFHFEKYLTYLSALSESVQVEGIHNSGGGIVYPSGAGFSFRSSLGDLILKNRQPTWYVDDMTFGKIFYENKIQIHRRELFSCVSKENIESYLSTFHSTTQFHYRFKTENRGEDSKHYTKFVDATLEKNINSI